MECLWFNFGMSFTLADSAVESIGYEYMLIVPTSNLAAYGHVFLNSNKCVKFVLENFCK